MAEFADKPGYAFNPGPPPEVTRYFEGRSLKPSFSFQDVEPEEHAVAFTVAKAMQLDVLTSIKEELERASAEGLSFAEFQKTLTPRLQKLGWWGVKDMVDPATGEAVKARLGSPRRLKTIWRSNMRAARAAGQWDRIERSKRALPYLLYQLGPSRQHRVEHAAKEGLVLPVDHPFWERWFPPNGWGCKCHVRQITRREAEQRGISEDPAAETRTVRNERTGEVREVPRGLDPAWDRNPGKRRQENAERHLAGELDAAPPEYARAAVIDMAKSWRMARLFEGSAKGAAPVAMLPRVVEKAIKAKTRVVTAVHQKMGDRKTKHPEATLAAYAQIQSGMETGRRFWSEKEGSLRVEWVEDGRVWRAIIRRNWLRQPFAVASLLRKDPGKKILPARADRGEVELVGE